MLSPLTGQKTKGDNGVLGSIDLLQTITIANNAAKDMDKSTTITNNKQSIAVRDISPNSLPAKKQTANHLKQKNKKRNNNTESTH